MEARFEIGLVEAWESHLGVHGDEERVEILGVVVLVFETRDGFTSSGDRGAEINANVVFAGPDAARRELDVAVFDFGGNGVAINGEIHNGAFAKIEENSGGRIGMKSEIFMPGCRWRMGRERKPEAVANVGKSCGALAGEFARNALGRRGGEKIAGDGDRKKSEEDAHKRKKFTRLAGASDMVIFSARPAPWLEGRSMMLR